MHLIQALSLPGYATKVNVKCPDYDDGKHKCNPLIVIGMKQYQQRAVLSKSLVSMSEPHDLW